MAQLEDRIVTPTVDSSTSADRRSQDSSGSQAAPQKDSPTAPVFRTGMLEPNSFLRAPFDTTTVDEGANDNVVQLDRNTYGDCFDPTAPTRVRDVGSAWQMDTDHDGNKN